VKSWYQAPSHLLGLIDGKKDNTTQKKLTYTLRSVLFVCVGNTGRSQMAEAFANHLGRGKITAISAGTIPAKEVNPTVVEAMLKKGIDISMNKPKKLTAEMFRGHPKTHTLSLILVILKLNSYQCLGA
jgi:hypothetical protein